MKSLFATGLLILMTISLSSQSIIAETYVEQTIYTPKIGTSIGYKFAGNIEVGGFIQRSAVELRMEDGGRPLNYEKEMIGAFFSYPLHTFYKTELQMKVRTGVSNMENFTITPSFHAAYRPSPIVAIGTGIGVRAFRPTFMASLQINLYGKKDRMLLSTMN